MSTATDIELRREGSIAYLQLTGADRLNPIGSHTSRALADAVRAIDADREIRAVVIHGEGRAFSAGADIDEINGFADGSDFSGFVKGITDALELIERSPVPFIAAIQGAAMGGGLELALACDLRVTARGVKLGLPEAKLGVLPGAGGTQRLPRLVPHTVAFEMLVTGRPITGERAYQIGLVNEVYDSPDEVLAAATVLAQELVAGAPLVPELAKSLLSETLTMSLYPAVEREREIATELFASEDGREGFASFVAKRPAQYRAQRG
ncbi:enoyl-CoA hydratase/isomerase family protein [Gordonia polyisoprenivorans]|uniref:enoyl-CoA hydratase/isomerase family protein n=1 Tax=Gordonia polyisoprenivorans TaxID=84595 RepID=UPI001AD65CBF|nr:enoyl-CoA hydratase/isomerase family protein [Gordonia polyisoprenivorans]QTI70975.1 enoyl-CoA hydratase/isomerase family protein [Gordonia polyisoprenivorans]